MMKHYEYLPRVMRVNDTTPHEPADWRLTAAVTCGILVAVALMFWAVMP